MVVRKIPNFSGIDGNWFSTVTTFFRKRQLHDSPYSMSVVRHQLCKNHKGMIQLHKKFSTRRSLHSIGLRSVIAWFDNLLQATLDHSDQLFKPVAVYDLHVSSFSNYERMTRQAASAFLRVKTHSDIERASNKKHTTTGFKFFMNYGSS